MLHKFMRNNPKITVVLLYSVPYIILILIFALTGRSIWNGFMSHYDEVLEYDKTRFVDDLIEEEKRKRIAFAIYNGMSVKDAEKNVQSLEPQFDKEKNKFFNYCTRNSKNCSIQQRSIQCFSCAPIDYLIFNGAYRTIDIKYIFDDESYKFFNEIKSVANKEYFTTTPIDHNRSLYKWDLVGYEGEFGDFMHSQCKHCGPTLGIHKIDDSKMVSGVNMATVEYNYSQYSIQIK